MGKYMRKGRGVEEIAVMEVGPLTRAKALALAAASGKRRKIRDSGAVGSRRVAPAKSISCRKSATCIRIPADRCPRSGQIAASRCSSNGSCEQVLQSRRSEDLEVAEGFETASDFQARERREPTTPSNLPMESDDYDSRTTSSEAISCRKSTAEKMPPSETEIEDFFAAAEKHAHRQFAEKYNFDVEKDMPLDGRYEWMRLK